MASDIYKRMVGDMDDAELVRELRRRAEPKDGDKIDPELGYAAARLDRLQEALRAIRSDMTHPRNSEAIVCTVWHSDIETVVDFITNTLGDENQLGDN
ncbi:MAG: hypothetical protein AAFR11_05695 [Pseudomonadota bacterium]